MRLRLPSFALVFSLLGAGLSAQSTTYFSARLTGDQEVPPVSTTAGGWGVVGLTGNKVSIFVEAHGLRGAAAHLHLANAGQNGRVIVPLTGGPTRWTGSGTLSTAQVSALRNSGTYLNVHTAAHRPGEIRGQVMMPHVMRLVAQLDGRQEVPPNRSTATGTGAAFLHMPDHVVVYMVRTKGLSNIAAAHMHRAPPGRSGPVMFPTKFAGGMLCGVTPRLSPAQVRNIRAGGMYFNVHTRRFPGGEIRGQILVQAAPALNNAMMTGANEVPPVRTRAHAHGCIELTSDNRIAYTVTSVGVRGTAAHIHKAAVGKNGPVIFPLTGGPIVWKGTTPKLTPAQLADLKAGLYYVNVHSRANPGGEVRGQVRPVMRPHTFGGGCPGSNRETPHIGANGLFRNYPCLGSSVEVVLTGGASNSAAVMLLGTSREKIGAASLPLSLDGLGATGCFLLTNIAFPVLVAPTNSIGCARQSLSIPLLPPLFGSVLYSQWVVVDRGANPASLTTSNGLAMRIQ